jgi:hypothetical protein
MKPMLWAALVGATLASVPLTAQLTLDGGADGESPPEHVVAPVLDNAAHGQTAPPDWIVWRVFHHSLEFYELQVPGFARQLLHERTGLSATEAATVSTLGRKYLAELDSIDVETRASLSARFRPQSNPLWNSPKFAGPPDPTNAIPPIASDGRSIRAVLEAEGFIARTDERRHATFRKHWETLAASVGLAKLVSLERFVQGEVAPGVRVLPQ